MSKSRTLRRTTAAAIAAAVCLGVAARAQLAPDAAALRVRGLEFGYNHDYEDATAAFRNAIAADAGDPRAYRLLAASAWIRMLLGQGAITVEDYLGQTRANLTRPPRGSELDRLFQDSLTQAIAIGERRVRERPDDADAHFQLGAALGVQASFVATIDGRVRDSLKFARRAYSEHERVLALDPSRKDAGLIVGMYRYIVSQLSLPARWGAYLAGFGGDRARGLRMIEDAARYPGDNQTNAMFMLVLFYNREGRFDDALTVIRTLQQRYPRNRLLWLEAGSTLLRAGRAADARVVLEDGLARLAADARPRAPGEMSRWKYAYGASLVATGDVTRAALELAAARDAAIRDWLRGRVHKELGKIADLRHDRATAITEYETADRLCRADADDLCRKDLRTLIRNGYRPGGTR